MVTGAAVVWLGYFPDFTDADIALTGGKWMFWHRQFEWLLRDSPRLVPLTVGFISGGGFHLSI